MILCFRVFQFRLPLITISSRAEWRHGRGGHLTLQDEDLTTKSVCGWKKLNTLEHYGVKESAVMSIIPRRKDTYNGLYKQFQNCEYYLFLLNEMLLGMTFMRPELVLCLITWD